MGRTVPRFARPDAIDGARRRGAVLMVLATVLVAGGADGPDEWAERLARVAWRAGEAALGWYQRTPPPERVAWGGLGACGVLGLGVLLERSVRLRRGRVIPAAFLERFGRRLADGQIDRNKGLDYCELNPSPASRVALAAIRRWGRPVADLERAVAQARRQEVDSLRRNVGTLRRVAALAPLVGLFGTLGAAARVMRAAGAAPAAWAGLADALAPLTVGVGVAILALVAFDALSGRVEGLAGDLDRIGGLTVEAIALAEPPPARADRPPIAGPVRPPHATYSPGPRVRDEP